MTDFLDERPQTTISAMTEHPEIVLLMTAKTTFDAKVIAGVLNGAGIPVFIGGNLLNDEFAVSRALANVSQVDLYVQATRLEEARQALREADESARLLDDPSFDPGPREDAGPGGD